MSSQLLYSCIKEKLIGLRFGDVRRDTGRKRVPYRTGRRREPAIGGERVKEATAYMTTLLKGVGAITKTKT